MAIENLAFPELIRYPNWGTKENSTWGRTGTYVDAAGEASSAIFIIPKTGSITKVHFGVGTPSVTGDIDVSLETVVASTGLPSGTLWDTNTDATAIDWDVSNVILTATLTAAASVTQGDIIAVKISANAASVPTGTINWADTEIEIGMPYRVADLGTPTKANNTCNVWIEYSDGAIPNIPWQRRLFSNTTSTANTTDRRYGIRFQLPFDAVVSGFWSQNDWGTGSNTVELYSTNGVTTLATQTVNGAFVQTVDGANPTYNLFATDVSLRARTWYRLTYATTTGTGAAHYEYNQPDITDITIQGGWDWITEDTGLTQPVHFTYTSAAAAPTQESSWVNEFETVIPMSLLISEISEWTNPDYAYLRRGRRAR